MIKNNEDAKEYIVNNRFSKAVSSFLTEDYFEKK